VFPASLGISPLGAEIQKIFLLFMNSKKAKIDKGGFMLGENLEKNNFETENIAQKEIDKKSAFKKAILATLCCWFLAIFLHLSHGFKIETWDIGLMIGRFIYDGGYSMRAITSTLLTPFYAWGYFPALIIGFYFALNKWNTYLYLTHGSIKIPFCKKGYVFLLISLTVFFIISLPIIIVMSGLVSISWPLHGFLTITPYFYIVSILILKLFYSGKERLLFIITGFLFIIFFIGSFWVAKYSAITTSPKLCEMIGKIEEIWPYDERCFYSLAQRTNNPAFCEKISENPSGYGFYSREDCRLEIASTFEGKCKDILKSCQNLSDLVKKNKCKQTITSEQKVIELYQMIDWDHLTDCGKEVRLTDKIISHELFTSCRSSNDKQSKENCIKETTLRKNDLKLCESILDEISCGNFFAVKTNDPTLCVRVSRAGNYDRLNSCVTEIAKNTKNPEVCKWLFFESKYERNSCLAGARE